MGKPLLFASLLPLLALAGCAAPPSARTAASPPDCDAAWARLRALAGTWDADLNGDGKPDTVVSWREVANGSALVETVFAGTPHEMITVYHRDGTRLLATHYCAAGNQPRLECVRASDGRVEMEMVDATNLPDPLATHMNGVTITFGDDGRATFAWTGSDQGVTSPHAEFRLLGPAAPPPALPEFAILMTEQDGAWKRLPEAEREALLAKYSAFVRKLRDEGRFVYGTPLGEPRIELAGNASATSTTGTLTGLFVVRARDLAEARSIAAECPALLHGETVTVRPASH